jgi:Ser/Thr protein kinase RdoA (MazF antagonist)/ribosomal protein S18 acetylase RimI-like enzyme
MMYLKNMVQGLENDTPAKELIKCWHHDAGSLKFWRASSNFVYLFQVNDQPHYLRFIHEEDRSAEQIQAELDFMLNLLNKGFATVAPIRSIQGNWIETISTENGHYHGVLFEQAKGVHIPLDQMSDFHFEEWGKSLAHLHHLSESYTPNAIPRKSWVDTLDFIASVLKSHPQEHEALEEYGRIKAWLSELPSGVGHTGLIHYDFETDNVFYMKDELRFSAIDFDDSMYHWFMMDITSALTDLIEQNNQAANQNILRFISGYQSVKHLDNDYIEMMPRFQRFAALYTFARLLRCMDNLDLLHPPDWIIQLRQKFIGICDQTRASFQPLIELKKITDNNWYACTQLEVTDEQKAVFPVPVVYWLAESAYCGMSPLSLYAEGVLVGFAVYAVDPDDGSYWIMAFMIDRKVQNRGFGRFGMEALIRYMEDEHNCERIVLGHRPENERASSLYASLGFIEVDRNDREIIRQRVSSEKKIRVRE